MYAGKYTLVLIGISLFGLLLLLVMYVLLAHDWMLFVEQISSRMGAGRGGWSDYLKCNGALCTILGVGNARARRGAGDYLKRRLDIGAAIILGAVLAPLMLVIALLIWLDSPGPILFRQRRAGRGGQPFMMCKFRTMHVGADATKQSLLHLNATGDPRLFKIPHDPRVTRIGSVLRKSSLDELPQLWNIIRGDMSLVGPRPFFMEDLNGYAAHHFRRLEVRPGLTGLWQVNGRSTVMDFEEVVRLDTQYVDNRSIWLDTQILLRTIPAVLRRDGAY